MGLNRTSFPPHFGQIKRGSLVGTFILKFSFVWSKVEGTHFEFPALGCWTDSRHFVLSARRLLHSNGRLKNAWVLRYLPNASIPIRRVPSTRILRRAPHENFISNRHRPRLRDQGIDLVKPVRHRQTRRRQSGIVLRLGWR